MFPEFQTDNMLQSKHCVICNIDFSRKDCLIRHMKSKHSNKELMDHYNKPVMTSKNDGMQQSDYNPTEYFEDGVNILLHRPTVQTCLDKYDVLKQQYNELALAYTALQDEIMASKDNDSAEKETSGSENDQSEDDDVCDEESVLENSQTEMQTTKNNSGPLSRISTPLNKLLNVLRGIVKLSRPEQRKFISTCHSDFLRYFAFFAREVVSRNVKLASDQLKKLRRQKRLMNSLARSRISLTTIRTILQTSGFLQLLLPLSIDMLSSVVNKH